MATNVNLKVYSSMIASMFGVSVAAATICGLIELCNAQSVKKITSDPYYSTLRQSQSELPAAVAGTPPPMPASDSFYQSAWEPPKTAAVATPARKAKLARAQSASQVWSSVARETTKPVTRIDFSRLDTRPTAKPASVALPQPLKPATVADAVAKASSALRAQTLTPIKAIGNFATAAVKGPHNAKAAIQSSAAKTRSIIRHKGEEIFGANDTSIAQSPDTQLNRVAKTLPEAKSLPEAKTLPEAESLRAAKVMPGIKAKPLTPWKDPSEFDFPKAASNFPLSAKQMPGTEMSIQSPEPNAQKIATEINDDSQVKLAAFEPQIGQNIKKIGSKIKSLAGTDRNTASQQGVRIADASNRFHPQGQTTYTPQGEVYSYPAQPEGVYEEQIYQGESFENSRVLALVGGHPVFVGDMMFEVNQILEKYMKGAPQVAKDAQKSKLMARLLPKYIDQKILYVSTLDQLPEGADIKDILKQAEKTFNDKALPDLMENSGVQSAAKFDAILRSQGTSVRQMRRAWAKDQISKFFLQEKVKFNRQVTHLEMLDEYRSNYDQYAVKGKVRWEQIEIQPAKAGGRFAAKDKIEDIYNRLVHGGNFEAIAKKESHGFRAFKGGQYDWTSKGSLVNKEIDKLIFTLPQGRLSDVIETKSGFHIIRVIERVEDHHTPFTEAQVEIKKQLLEARRDVAFRTYIDGLKDKINVEYVNE